jgi:hypothetical protein
LLEIHRFRPLSELLDAVPNRFWKYAWIAEQPRFSFMNSEVLAETRVSDATLQLGFGPGTFGVRAQVRRERQDGAIQVQQADNSDQPSGIEISLGPLGVTLQVFGTPREAYRLDTNRMREFRVKPALQKRG